MFSFRKDVAICSMSLRRYLHIGQTEFILYLGKLSKGTQISECLNSGLDLLN